jgi:hypothetical protein
MGVGGMEQTLKIRLSRSHCFVHAVECDSAMAGCVRSCVSFERIRPSISSHPVDAAGFGRPSSFEHRRILCHAIHLIALLVITACSPIFDPQYWAVLSLCFYFRFELFNQNTPCATLSHQSAVLVTPVSRPGSSPCHFMSYVPLLTRPARAPSWVPLTDAPFHSTRYE